MSDPRPVGCCDYVNRPYAEVRALLQRDPLGVIQRATTSATARARSTVTRLHVELGAVGLSVDVRVVIRNTVDETVSGALPALRVSLTWEALRSPAFFPSMLADLRVWPLSARQTQVEVLGSYWVPMGALGKIFETAVGDRIAKATADGFLADLIEEIQGELPPHGAGAP